MVTEDMVGQKIAVFLAVETKSPGKKPTKEQSAFLAAVKLAGGIAVLARSVSEFLCQLTSTT